MAPMLPLRLLGRKGGDFFVFETSTQPVDSYDIISYTWGDEVQPYKCDIPGVDWDVTIAAQKLGDIKRLMMEADIRYLWVDCICINQTSSTEKAFEIAKMYEYYKSALKCHILMDMPVVWNPQEIVDNLKFIDHVLSYMGGAALASEAIGLTPNLINRLAMWANDKDWTFDVDKSLVRSASVDMGVVNCYSTCIKHVISLFDNLYFTRVWTFQEMILGKNVTMWGINRQIISCLGELHVWMDLTIESKDKAYKLQEWIRNSRVLKTASVNAILRIIEEDNELLESLQLQVRGINCAKTDIINGGPNWWYENYKGVSNIFSAFSLTPRRCKKRADIFRGLLGVFSGLFSAEEIERDLSGDDMEGISFRFFKQLSLKTGLAWTKLAVSSKERGEWDWIPLVESSSSQDMATDCLASVVHIGRLKQNGQAKTQALTGIKGTPRKYMKITLEENRNSDFQFIFKGCNCGKKVKTGTFSKEPIPINDHPKDIMRDETGRVLVQCATILGSIMDPTGDITQYRRRLLYKLQPYWEVSDPNAKPTGWVDRCVSGTPWANPHTWIRPHNWSMNYRMVDLIRCGSRLANGTAANISCKVTVNCGCIISGPFSLIFEAITAVYGSFLGDTSATLDADNRIILKDGLGLVQVGDIGRTFSLVSFGGDINSYRSHASSCRSTKIDRPVLPALEWPIGRALVREEFVHDMTNMMRDYGYVETGGSGNLLICRNHPLGPYKLIGVCVDEHIFNTKGRGSVTIR
ncbi:hypothetical protein QQS21_003261 [Conoideocrella luteorostrata]|uniref:Heterokaryon incompatibility domain-containing protein n=1 Tax=Conoideocrella luteorostrata TaxID=1105319 RepID=A0AAJ0CTN9_9HYPO|nr:hypothetical protein QQS21_003261 [Conoideocrella luteorostrata]